MFENLTSRIFFDKLKTYVYAYCKIDNENRRIPIYIGKGKGSRCLAHLKNLTAKTDTKSKKILELKNKKKTWYRYNCL